MDKKIVSIDLWGTLIKASPYFKDSKAQIVKSIFTDLEKEYILNAFNLVKKNVDFIIERTGWQPKRFDLWKLWLSYVYPETVWFDDYYDSKIFKAMDLYDKQALIDHPTIYSDDTIDTLEKLSDKYNLILSSNTLFLESDVMYGIIEKLNLTKYFSRMLFSDKLGVSKPNRDMYENSSYHIGDNILTDYYGPKSLGIDAYLINSNGRTISNALDYINNKEKKSGIK